MKSSIFKRSLLASMASLTALSNFSGSVSTKIYATEPEMQESIDEVNQKPFATCSCKGFNFKIYCFGLSEEESEKENRVKFLKKFKEIMDPYDETIPVCKEFNCKFIFFDEVVKTFLSIENPEDQRKYLEDACLRSYTLSAACSYGGYNLIFDFSGLTQEQLKKDKFVEKFKELIKNRPFDEELPKEKTVFLKLKTVPEFFEIMKNISLMNPRRQERSIKDFLDDVLKEYVEKKTPKFIARCSYGKYNLCFDLSELIENKSDEKIVTQFMERFNKLTKNNPRGQEVPREDQISEMWTLPPKFKEVIVDFLSKNLVEQNKIIKDFLECSLKEVTEEYILRCSYENCNLDFDFNVLIKNKLDEERVTKFIKKFRKFTKPYDENIPEDRRFVFDFKDGISLCDEIMKRFILMDSKDQEKFVSDFLRDAAERVASYDSEVLIEYSYKGYNISDVFDIRSLNEKEKKMVREFAKRFKELSAPYGQNTSKNGYRQVWKLGKEFKEIIERFMSETPEHQETAVKLISERSLKNIKKFIENKNVLKFVVI